MNDITKPLITTIIPTYQRPKLLRRAIKSVLNQIYPHFQVCVYDNASGDETEAVVREFTAKEPRIRYFRQGKNRGEAFNSKLFVGFPTYNGVIFFRLLLIRCVHKYFGETNFGVVNIVKIVTSDFQL